MLIYKTKKKFGLNREDKGMQIEIDSINKRFYKALDLLMQQYDTHMKDILP